MKSLYKKNNTVSLISLIIVYILILFIIHDINKSVSTAIIYDSVLTFLAILILLQNSEIYVILYEDYIFIKGLFNNRKIMYKEINNVKFKFVSPGHAFIFSYVNKNGQNAKFKIFDPKNNKLIIEILLQKGIILIKNS